MVQPRDTEMPPMAATEKSDARRLVRLREELLAGLDDLAAGRVSDGKDVFARLRARFSIDPMINSDRRPGEGRDPPLRGRGS